MILELIALAEKLAVVIDGQITAHNTASEAVAWTASQQFYLQGLGTLKAKIAAEQAAQAQEPSTQVVGG
jgi:hypothetical protein